MDRRSFLRTLGAAVLGGVIAVKALPEFVQSEVEMPDPPKPDGVPGLTIPYQVHGLQYHISGTRTYFDVSRATY